MTSATAQATFAVDFVDDLVGGFGPDERVAARVRAVDELSDLGVQLADGAEGAAVQGLFLDDGEPDLDDLISRHNPDALVVVGVPFGHTRPQWILPYGGDITVDGDNRKAWASYD